MRGLAVPFIAALLAVGLSHCGGDPPECVTKCCQAGDALAKRCNACGTAEIEVNQMSCEPLDGSTPSCGDGQFQPALEQCDTTAARACADATKVCTACLCIDPVTAVCGDGMVTGPEGCERNAQCNSSVGVCRRCQCVPQGQRAEFLDTRNDVALTPQGYSLESVAFEVDGGNDDRIYLGFDNLNGVQPDKVSEACVVVVVAAGQEQRLCLEKAPAMERLITFTGVDGIKRTITNTTEATQGMAPDGGFILTYKPLLGFQVEAGLSFYAETRYDGARTDVLPDTGTISFKEIFGE